MSKSIRLLETTYSIPTSIDKEAGIIKHAKVLGRESKNGRTYSDKAMDSAARLYEIVEINVDHPDRKNPDRERGMMEGFGVPKNITREADGVYADIHYLKSHPYAPIIVERVERGFPIGLSHNADGKLGTLNRKPLVEDLHRVYSIDVVRNPATNRNLFESENRIMAKTVREILESAFPGKTEGCSLLEMDDGAMAAMPVEMPDESSSDDQIWEAFKSSILAVVDDEKMDTKATLKKIGEILKAYDKLTGSAKSDAPADAPAQESVQSGKSDPALAKLLESVTRMERRDAARTLAEEFGIQPDAALLESLVKLPDAEMRKLCERESKLRPARGKSKPLMESRYQAEAATVTYPKDSKEFAKSLR